MLGDTNEFSLPALEEKVLEFWRVNSIFKKSLANKKKARSFVFYEGPPTANGKPGIHHMLARAFKDIIPRYKTMKGFHVPRKGGWDTHGLPVELEVEKKLGLSSKKDIEKFGISEFNKACRESVWKYKDEWERFTERIGFWLDLEDPYVTYENKYIESVWHILQHAWKQKLLYRGHKVIHWCTRCGTALSSHEVALGYREISDRSVYIKFPIIKGQTIGMWKVPKLTFVLAWTTTPWTLPGNIALAVGENIDYVITQNPDNKSETIILARERASALGIDISNAKSVKGKSLLGISYAPLFDVKTLVGERSYKIYKASFVTTTDGTGIVHTAVMYGEDDYNLGIEENLPQHHTVAEDGTFTDDVVGFSGKKVRTESADIAIIDHLKKRGTFFKEEKYTHEYPFCWRCGTAIIYYARASWFIKMSALRTKLNSANETIHWTPSHLKKGRFGEWLRGAKDWAISRERYWGTPLPIWNCDKCHATHVVGSADELSKCFPNSRNTYILVRHGESESNILNAVSGWPEKTKHHLTLRGRVQVEKLAHVLGKQRVDLIISSDITRTKETREILSEKIEGERVSFDKRLREIDTGDFNGCHDTKYRNYYKSDIEKFTKQPPNGESLSDLRARVFGLLHELEEKYQGKTIVIVSHEYPLWMLEMVMHGWSVEEAVREKHARGNDFYKTAEAREVQFKRLPRDETGLADFHRPYIDEITWKCSKCAGTMRRTSEVLDVWFDSGAMPFAQYHYPFEGKNILAYPGDYISEGVDQTRGWFYTLLAVATILGKRAPYKNVISLGHVLDTKGQKMSKSKGNAVDPWILMEKYGADALRWYFFTMNPAGEPKRFNEADVSKTLRQSLLLVYNSFIFFKTYAHKNGFSLPKLASKNILDQWINMRLSSVISDVTDYLEKYEVTDAARSIEIFISDLSRWYIRRSRRRFQQPESISDHKEASQTLFALLTILSKLLAPFTPFFADGLYKSLISEKGASVHLESWPKTKIKKEKKLIDHMQIVRELASAGLAKRAEAGIKTRQPLSELRVKNLPTGMSKELLSILCDEVNVKSIRVDKNLKDACELDTVLTHSLREEGLFRAIVRLVQELRQDAKLTPKDQITFAVTGSDELIHVISSKEKEIKKETRAKRIEYRETKNPIVRRETKIDEYNITVGIKK